MTAGSGRSDLGARVAVAAVGIPIVLLALWLGGWAIGALAAAVAMVATHEFYGLARARGVHPFHAVGITASGAVVLLATALPTVEAAGPVVAGILVLTFLISLGGAVWLRWPGGEPLAAVGTTLVGVVYVGCALAFIPILRSLPDTVGGPGALGIGPWRATSFVLLPLFTTWASDTGAFFVGRAWGRRKLAPSASPKKTIEGAVAGLLASMTVAGLLAWWGPARFPDLTLPVSAALWVGLLLGMAAQVGDLAESVLKREAGVKDSGTLLPGHGGFLDRVDALLFAFPVAWLLLLAAGVLP